MSTAVGLPQDVAADPRWDELGELLVRRCVAVAPGERVMIAMGEIASYPLALAVNRAVIRAGGLPQIQFLSEYARHAVLQEGSDEQLAWIPEVEKFGMEWADCYIALRGGFPLSLHDDVSADRLATNQRAQGVVSSMRWSHTRWVLIRVPDPSLAAQAGMEFGSYLDMFFTACLLDWDEELARQRRWIKRLETGRTIRITGRETDLTFSVEGRTWMTSAGEINMPDGEVYTAPVTGTEHGTIFFENPAVLGGRLVHGLRLTWEHGVLTSATAESNEEFLASILATDVGATQIGEFAIGSNAGIDRFSDDILLDEKIAGTCHVALGRAYPQCGGTNSSAVHWDIVKDIRSEGAVWLDDQIVVTDGQILLD